MQSDSCMRKEYVNSYLTSMSRDACCNRLYMYYCQSDRSVNIFRKLRDANVLWFIDRFIRHHNREKIIFAEINQILCVIRFVFNNSAWVCTRVVSMFHYKQKRRIAKYIRQKFLVNYIELCKIATHLKLHLQTLFAAKVLNIFTIKYILKIITTNLKTILMKPIKISIILYII